MTTFQSASLTTLAWKQFVRHRPALVGLGIVLLVATAVAFGPLVWPNSTERIDFASVAQGPSWKHPFGTDDLGRDIFARILAGGRVSLSVGALATLVSIVVGTLVGMLGGYFAGWVDNVLMRLVDLFLVIPTLPVLILCTALFAGKGTFQQRYVVVVVVIGILNWMVGARLVRASTLSIRHAEYITAARGIGVTSWRIMLRHILPNVMSTVIVTGTLSIGASVLLESALSFLGLGFQPPQATWGRMLFEAQPVLAKYPHIALVPGGAIVVFVLAVNYVGDGLRDALDPHLRH